MLEAIDERRVLVIGSQCKALNSPLSFLPHVAESLYRVMTDPTCGDCVSALEEAGLLLDPTVEATYTALRIAIERAARDEATLFLALIGHGHFAEGDEDFYFLPHDACYPPDSRGAIHLVQLIKERLQQHSVDGLVVLLDACYGGVAAQDAAARWGRFKWPLRFEMLTAANDRPAADGCFTKCLITVLENGLKDHASDTIRCEKVHEVLKSTCSKQEPRHPTLDADEGLYLARNAARFAQLAVAPWIGTLVSTEIERLTACYQPIPLLEAVVDAAPRQRCVAVVGAAGTGKSALSAVLARSEASHGKVPPHFAQAVYFISERTTPQELGSTLAEQLGRSVPPFREAQAAFKASMPLQEFNALETIERELLKPLGLLRDTAVVQLIIDGLDRASGAAQGPVRSAVDVLATDPRLSHVHLVLTSRPGTPLPLGSHHLRIEATDDAVIQAYLARRGVPPARRPELVARARGNWLIAGKLADLVLADPARELKSLPEGLEAVYEEYLRRAGAADTERWRRELRPVLAALAAAGVGPVLPLTLLRAASGRLGGPEGITPVRDSLVALRGLAVRGAPGTASEQAGVFHQTLAEYVLDSTHPFGVDAAEAHAALAAAIAELAPREQHDPYDPLHRYAMEREAEHLWVLGRHTEALDALSQRTSVIPAENLRRWTSWLERLGQDYGPDHPDTLATRGNIAHWTGQTGEARAALELSQALLPDQARVLGPDHPDTLTTRSNIARWTGQTGEARAALELFQALLPDQARVLGPDHPDTLITRSNIAHWTGQTGEARAALDLFQALLPDQARVLGPDHPETRETQIARDWIVHLQEKLGDIT